MSFLRKFSRHGDKFLKAKDKHTGRICPQCGMRLDIARFYMLDCSHCGWRLGTAANPLPGQHGGNNG